jgi:hypothetical protein
VSRVAAAARRPDDRSWPEWLATRESAARRALLAAAAGVVLVPLLADARAPLPDGPTLGAPWWTGVGALVAGAAWLLHALAARARRERGDTMRPRRASELLLLGALPLYLLCVGNGALLSSADNLPTRWLPSLLLQERTLDLSGLPPFATPGDHYASWWIGERRLSAFPLGTAFLALPHAALALAGSRGEVNEGLVLRWEKHFAALLATASALLLFLALRRRAGEGPALAAALVFAVATPAFTYGGQGLWSTTGETLCLSAALYALLGRGVRPATAFAAGLALGLAFLCRPTALIPMGALGVLLLLSDRRSGAIYALTCMVALAAATAFLWSAYGHPLGGYGIHNAHAKLYGRNLGEGLLGNLVSPSRGILVWLPYLLFVPAALRRADRGDARAWTWLALAVVGATFLLAASYERWEGAWSIGPRLMTESAPFLALLTLPLWRGFGALRPALRAALVLAVAGAGATQVAAAYRGRAAFEWNPTVDHRAHPEVLRSWRNSQLAAIWWPGWRYRLDPAEAATVAATDREAGRLVRIDLAPAANARFDEDPFRPHVAGAWPRFARIDPEALNLPGARFHFASRGAPNALTTCRVKQAPALRIPSLAAWRIHGLLSAFVTGEATRDRPLAVLELEYADGAREELPVRLGEEVFPYLESPRETPVPGDRVYLGDPAERQVLVETSFTPGRGDAEIVALRPRNAGAGPNEGIVVLALTLEVPDAALAADDGGRR